MDSNLFWFNDEQWAKIVRICRRTRPGPGARTDRRILSGIMHVLKIGCRWSQEVLAGHVGVSEIVIGHVFKG
jgi:hypothetical protein